MARSTAAAKPDPQTFTNWSAAYTDVGGEGAAHLDPNEIGIDPLPDEVRDQFNALAEAARVIVGAKAVGMVDTFNVTLEGSASPGHDSSSEYAKVSVTKGPNLLSVEPDPATAPPVYVVTRYTDQVGDPLPAPEETP